MIHELKPTARAAEVPECTGARITPGMCAVGQNVRDCDGVANGPYWLKPIPDGCSDVAGQGEGRKEGLLPVRFRLAFRSPAVRSHLERPVEKSRG